MKQQRVRGPQNLRPATGILCMRDESGSTGSRLEYSGSGRNRDTLTASRHCTRVWRMERAPGISEATSDLKYTDILLAAHYALIPIGQVFYRAVT